MIPEVFLTYMILLVHKFNENNPPTVMELATWKRSQDPDDRVGHQMLIITAMREYRTYNKKSVEYLLYLPEVFDTFLMRLRA